LTLQAPREAQLAVKEYERSPGNESSIKRQTNLQQLQNRSS